MLMQTEDLIKLYSSLLETWQFQVNSHWQRSSFFAAFETVAVGACWKLLAGKSSGWSTTLAAFGILLTAIWYLINNKSHSYAEYWLRAVSDMEKRFAANDPQLAYATALLTRPRNSWIRHRYLEKAVPALFLAIWTILFVDGILTTIGLGEMHSPLEIAALITSAASFLAGAAAVWIAKSSLSQARQVAERDQHDWRQRKWFDLYFKADEAYDSLDQFQALYTDASSSNCGTVECQREQHKLMWAMRTVHRMAVVFPKDPVIDALFSATAAFSGPGEATSKARLTALLDAVEGVRKKALIDTSVLAC